MDISQIATLPIPTALWIGFNLGVLTLLILDLTVFNRKAHVVTVREALITSAVWIVLALSFNAGFGYYIAQVHGEAVGKEVALQFLTGYLIEESLSVDNLFVILLVFQSFRIPAKYQHRVLFWGILGAIVMRAGLIIAGAQLVQQHGWILYIFGGILLFTAGKLLFESDDKSEVTEHWAVTLVKKVIPVTSELHGQHFLVRPHGRLNATPLFLALVVIEITDLIFAVDSIPAVFSVTQNPFIAYASNILAILGLRSMYFVIADFVSRLRYLKPGLAAILGFVGVKMLITDFYHIPSWVSLLVLAGILTTAGLTSWYAGRVSDQK